MINIYLRSKDTYLLTSNSKGWWLHESRLIEPMDLWWYSPNYQESILPLIREVGTIEEVRPFLTLWEMLDD